MTTEPRRLAHIGDDEAFTARLHDAFKDMHRLPSRNPDQRPMEPIQPFVLQILRGAGDSKLAACGAEIGQDGSEDCKAECTGRCGRARAFGAGNTRAGEVQNDGCTAATTKG